MKKLYLLILAIFFLMFSQQVFAGTSIPFTVNMSETVNVTGTPRIAVTVGGSPTRYADYTSGTGTSALTFTYNMTAGDIDLDGVTLVSPIDLNGGTLKDLNGNDATLAFTVPNTSNVKVDYPSLSMNFIYDSDGRYSLNGFIYDTLPTFLSAASGSFTRPSIGTYFDSSGVLQTATSGVPRFAYDPVTHAANGILIEEQRTNLLLRSSEFENAVWSSKLNATLTADTVSSPDGTTSADMWTRNSATASYVGEGTAKAASSLVYTYSIFAKKNVGNYVALRLQGSYPSRADMIVNLNTGTISTTANATSSFTSASGSIQNVGNGWYRISLSATSDTHTNIICYVSFNSNGGVLDATDSVSNSSGYLWGAQLEQAAFSTSHIPTTTAAVSRSADALVIPTGSWYNSATSTLYGYGIAAGSTTGSAATFADLNDNSFNNRFQIRINSGPFYSGIITSGSVVQSVIGSGTYSFGTAKKIAMASQLNDAVIYADGVSRGTDNAVTMPVSISKLRIGAVATGAEYMNGNIQMIKYYPARIPDAQLQLLTQ